MLKKIIIRNVACINNQKRCGLKDLSIGLRCESHRHCTSHFDGFLC